MKILDFLPLFLRQIKQLSDLLGDNGAIQIQFDKLQTAIETAKKSMHSYVDMPHELLVRCAKSYGVPIRGDDSVIAQTLSLKTEDRRPYTEKRVKEFLSDIIGEENYSFQLNKYFTFVRVAPPGTPLNLRIFPKYQTKLTVALVSEDEAAKLACVDMLESVLPLNIVLEVGMYSSYITYSDLENAAYSELHEKEYNQLRRK